MRIVVCVILILLSSLLTPLLFGHKIGTAEYGESYFICLFVYAMLYGIATLAYSEINNNKRY